MDITLVIPTYNEAGNIPILVERVFNIFSDAGLDGKIIIVDDDSPDQTWKVAENLQDKYPNLKVLRRLGKRGLSSAVLDGFAMANTEIVGVIDADLSHPPEKIPELVAPIINGEADFTLGSRYIDQGEIENWPLKRKISSKIATLAVLGLTKVKDPMSGFFFLKRDVIKNIELNPQGFKIGLEILVRGNFNKVIEVPIIFRDRVYGESKLSSNVILDYLLHVSKLYIYKIFKMIRVKTF
jgi:dolichol-phosphate mannosyltransferase